MFITKKHLSRRTFLNGVGVTVVVTVCANNGVPIAAAISGSKIFMPKVF